MEPVTHVLTGVCLARAGCNRRAAYATLTMAVAAQFPDIDTLWGLRGPVEGFAHHRGITHTFLGLPFEAAFLVGTVYGLHRWRVARAARTQSLPGHVPRPLTKAPVRWGALYGFALLALLSHLLLDYTNNYGLRPFFPFNGHWYAGSIVFIFDPLIFLLLLGALVAPSLFALVSAEVGAKRPAFRGRGWAVAALLGVVAWWGLRTVQHAKAVRLAMAQTYAQTYAQQPPPTTSSTPLDDNAPLPTPPPPTYLPALRALASPDPLSPFHWSVVTDFGPLYQMSEVDTLATVSTPDQTTYAKPDRDRETLLAQSSPLGRVYMDWSPVPVVVEGKPAEGTAEDTVADPVPPDATTVTFQDLRFMGQVPWLHLSHQSPLTGTVTLDARGRVIRQTLDGRTEP